MPTSVDELLKVCANPRVAPLRLREDPLWKRALPPTLAAVGAIVALLAIGTRDLGLLASGAAVWSVGACAAQGRWADMGLRIHLTAGVLALALIQGGAVAGAFAPATAMLVVAALAARSTTTDLRRTMSPMSGSVPWEFRSSYRRHALRYGGIGLLIGIVLVVAAPSPILKIMGVACVPLALRTFAMQLLRPAKSATVWIVVGCFHVAALAAFVPSHGAIAAAWIVVAAESMLLVGAATVIARRTGVSPFPLRTFAIGGGTALLVCAAAVPGTGVWPFLVTLVVAAIASIFVWPQKTS